MALNFGRVQARKEQIVEQLHKGVQFLMKKNKIDVYIGNGRVIGPSIFSPQSGAVAVEPADGERSARPATSDHRHRFAAAPASGLEADGEQ